MEVLLAKTDYKLISEDKNKAQPLAIITEVQAYLSGNTISYVEFSQGMIKNRTLLNDIYDPIYNKKAYTNFE